MTSMKGWYFRRIMDERVSIMPEVLYFYRCHEVGPEDFISIIKTGLFYLSINIIVNMIFYIFICRTIFCMYRMALYYQRSSIYCFKYIYAELEIGRPVDSSCDIMNRNRIA